MTKQHLDFLIGRYSDFPWCLSHSQTIINIFKFLTSLLSEYKFEKTVRLSLHEIIQFFFFSNFSPDNIT